jgi:hypothetical protein
MTLLIVLLTFFSIIALLSRNHGWHYPPARNLNTVILRLLNLKDYCGKYVFLEKSPCRQEGKYEDNRGSRGLQSAMTTALFAKSSLNWRLALCQHVTPLS